ncbi:MAG: hypothetical protein ACO3PO_03665 [Limisphaerales bacterium]
MRRRQRSHSQGFWRHLTRYPLSMRAQFTPYYAWANRAESEISVWLPLAP